jgi:hypothetical protein
MIKNRNKDTQGWKNIKIAIINQIFNVKKKVKK